MALARALITDPQVVLFDEPTTGLDPVRKINVLSLIVENQKKFRFTGVLVSHDVPDVFYISNRIILIDQGHVLFQGSPQELEHDRHEVVREFIDSLKELENRVLSLKSGKDLDLELADFSGRLTEPQEFTLMVLVLDNFEGIKEELGLLTAHKLLARLSASFNREVAEKNGLTGRDNERTLVGFIPGGEHDISAISDRIRQDLTSLAFVQEADTKGHCLNFRLQIGVFRGTKRRPLKELISAALSGKSSFLDLGCVKWKQQG